MHKHARGDHGPCFPVWETLSHTPRPQSPALCPVGGIFPFTLGGGRAGGGAVCLGQKPYTTTDGGIGFMKKAVQEDKCCTGW